MGHPVEHEDFAFPPLNGTPTILGKVCDGVEVVDEGDE